MQEAIRRLLEATRHWINEENEMSERLMEAADLERVTGKKRYSKQAEWFKTEFGVDVPRRDDHSVVMTWAAYEALCLRKMGLTSTSAPGPAIVELCYD